MKHSGDPMSAVAPTNDTRSMTPETPTLSERMLEEVYVGGIASWDDMIDEVATLEKQVEAAGLTIGTLQADRIKAQATIDHYRTMLEAAEKALAGIRLVTSNPPPFSERRKLKWVHDFADDALAGEKP